MAERYEAIVIGTGFGGAVNAARLSKRWPGRVLVFERGKRYPMGSFPRSPHDTARNFWNVPVEGRRRPKSMPGDKEEYGMWDIRNYRHMDVVLCAGLGGGSLIYANVFLEPPDHVFDERWPESCKKPQLGPYYAVAKRVLGSRPIPQNGDQRRKIIRTELFQKVAKELGRESKLVDINVFFGNDFSNPLEIGAQDRNRHGALQTSCVYCGECDVGCNTHSKNTLDLNYLFVAEHRHGADVRTEHLVDRIVPLNADGNEDPEAGGTHGFRVFYRDLAASASEELSVDANRVVVSAGSLGSSELLLRCKEIFGSLPRLSNKLGHQFSGNGDFLSFVMGGDSDANPTYGPVITQRTDFNLFNNWDPNRAFILEDAGYPAFAAWYTEGIKPGYLRLGAFWQTAVAVARRLVTGRKSGSIGYALGDLLKGDLSSTTSVLLCMGIDKSNGTMSLDGNGRLDLDWPYRDSLALYEAILDAGKQFKGAVHGKAFIPIPNWLWPFRKNVSVHSLGGSVLGDSAATGVTSADRANFGECFGYKNLHVADGSIVPTAVGANPTATIAALSEMVAESITGITPDASGDL